MTDGTIAIINRGQISDSLVDWLWQQPRSLHLVRPRGREIARQRNVAIEEMRGEFILYVDSDNVPPVNAIELLLSVRAELVGGVILDREFNVCAIKTREPWARWTLDELTSYVVAPSVALGAGCMLVRRSLLNRMSPPYFRCGRLNPEFIGEDADFCLRASDAGAIPWLHCDVRVGHDVACIRYPDDTEILACAN